MIKLSTPFFLSSIAAGNLFAKFHLPKCLLLLVGLWAGCYPGFSQVTFENAFPSLTFEFPVEIQNTGVSNDDRLFVVGQRGTIQVLDNNPSTSTAQQFLDIRSSVFFNAGQELGLLGLAFHPDYATNGFFYVYYTRSAGGTPEIIVERFRVASDDADQADPSSREVIFRVVKNQSNSNHNGGKIAFGPDGYLYVSIGDGGGGGDPRGNGQNVNTYFGSILRLDVDLDGSNPTDANGLAPEGRYEIPTGNPLVNQEGLDEIYAWGIRNTWKMSFDPPTGRLWGGDVGQNSFEEINLITPGNFGWNRFEGVSVFNSNVPDPGNAIDPAFFYNRSNGDVSITGGYVYRGSQIASTAPSIAGKYVFADYVSGRVWVLDYNATTGEATRELLFRASNNSGSINVSTFGLDSQGEMYFAGYGSSGALYKLKDGTTNEDAVAVEGVGDWNDDLGNIKGEVNAIVTTDDQAVYVGGNFSEVGAGVTARNVARWTPSDGWQALGEGTNGVVNALALGADGTLYVGGSFTTAGNTSANNVVQYNSGSGWESLATGVDGAVLALSTAGNTLYAGGAFATADGTVANNVARWDGGWSALTDSDTQQAGTNNEVRSMAVDEAGILYVGGNFGSAGGTSASRIARWNGDQWSSLGEGTSGFVQSIVITDEYLYAGGNFTIAGNQTVNRIARWDRSASTWSPLSSGLSNSVNTMVADGDFLYVGGQFRNALNAEQDNIIVNNVVRWSEGDGWEALGEGTDVGVDNLVNAFSLNGTALRVGGRFETVGNQAIQNLATWSAPSVSPATPIAFEAGKITIQQAKRTDWLTVNLDQSFTQPVVVVSPPTYNGGQPTTVRVRNVSSSSFEVQIDEWEYLDGWHLPEELSYLVMEAGSHTLGGLQVEAGRLSANDKFRAQSFAEGFSAPPVVLVQCASDNESSAVATHLQNVSADGFAVRLQEEEAADGAHADEDTHYIALAPGTGTETDWKVEVARLDASFNHQWKSVDFSNSQPNPLCFAAIQSDRRSDPATLRYRTLNADRVEMKIEEEQSKDNEEWHPEEAVGYLVLSDQEASSARVASKTVTSEELQLYPNPVRVGEEVTFEGTTAGLQLLTVYNVQGQVLIEEPLTKRLRINTSSWQPGLYFVSYQGAQGAQTRKLLITQ